MTTTARMTRSIAALNLPKPVPALISLTNGIVTAMTGNPSFSTPTPSLTSVMSALDDLVAAEAIAQTRARGAAATRNAKRAVLVSLLEQLKGYVQKVADGSPAAGGAIIQSAGLSLKKVAPVHKRVFGASPGAVSGTVRLITDAAGSRAAYEWQWSADGGEKWVSLPTTLQAKTTVTGLSPGASVSFRYRAVTRVGQEDWAQAIAMIVK